MQSAMNTSHNRSIGMTPIQALIGCETRTTVEARILNEVSGKMHRLDLKESRKLITGRITDAQSRQKEYYDTSRKEAQRYNEGNLVLVQITSEAVMGGVVTPKI